MTTALELLDEVERLRKFLASPSLTTVRFDEAIEALRAELCRPGWVMVPEVPTEEMIAAGVKVKYDRLIALRDDKEIAGVRAGVIEDWTALIAARPGWVMVPVSINMQRKEIPTGPYTVAKLKEVLGVYDDYDLDRIVVGEGRFEEIRDDEVVTIAGSEHFVSHIRRAGSSP